jgi:hypothetical protein
MSLTRKALIDHFRTALEADEELFENFDSLLDRNIMMRPKQHLSPIFCPSSIEQVFVFSSDKMGVLPVEVPIYENDLFWKADFFAVSRNIDGVDSLTGYSAFPIDRYWRLQKKSKPNKKAIEQDLGRWRRHIDKSSVTVLGLKDVFSHEFSNNKDWFKQGLHLACKRLNSSAFFKDTDFGRLRKFHVEMEHINNLFSDVENKIMPRYPSDTVKILFEDELYQSMSALLLLL